MVNFDSTMLEFFLRLFVASLLGILLGVERAAAGKTAGLRTYGLISLGSALFVVISESVVSSYAGLLASVDPLRVPAQIVTGIGFVGAGLIFVKSSEKIKGVTTATGLWVAAGIGIAAGFGFFEIAVFSTILAIFILSAMWHVDRFIRHLRLMSHERREREDAGDDI